MIELGRRIKKARKEKGLSLYRLSIQMGVRGMSVSPQGIARWELGNAPSSKYLPILSIILGKRLSYFFAQANKTSTRLDATMAPPMRRMTKNVYPRSQSGKVGASSSSTRSRAISVRGGGYDNAR